MQHLQHGDFVETLDHGPQQDLVVSPQHRMLIRSKIATRLFNTREVLVPAKKLVGLRGIEIAEDIHAVTYYHFMCDAHEVIWAEGAPVETLFLGPEALKSLSHDAVIEIERIFGSEIFSRHPSARIIPRGKQARELVLRHQKTTRTCCPS